MMEKFQADECVRADPTCRRRVWEGSGDTEHTSDSPACGRSGVQVPSAAGKRRDAVGEGLDWRQSQEMCLCFECL